MLFKKNMYRTMHEIIWVKSMNDKCLDVGVYKHSDNIL